MKELEKTKRISVASTVFILAVLIGVLTFKRPQNQYAMNTQSALMQLISTKNLISFDNIDKTKMVLMDIRPLFEYEKGHIENAIHLAAPEILNETNQAMLTELNSSNKTIVLYGENIQQANMSFMMLYQLGFKNVKILAVDLSYEQNKLNIYPNEIEISRQDIPAFINESNKNRTNSNTSLKPKSTPKKVITVQKKKKREAEGGC